MCCDLLNRLNSELNLLKSFEETVKISLDGLLWFKVKKDGGVLDATVPVFVLRDAPSAPESCYHSNFAAL